MVIDDELFTEAIVHRLFEHAGAEPAIRIFPPGFQFKLNSVVWVAYVTAVPDTLTDPVTPLIWPLKGVIFQPPQNPLLGKQPVLESLAHAGG
jgi:hypothetical protein